MIRSAAHRGGHHELMYFRLSGRGRLRARARGRGALRESCWSVSQEKLVAGKGYRHGGGAAHPQLCHHDPINRPSRFQPPCVL